MNDSLLEESFEIPEIEDSLEDPNGLQRLMGLLDNPLISHRPRIQ